MSMSFLSLVEAELPPGFRFHPRDDELICDYLAPKLGGKAGFSGCRPPMVDVDLNKILAQAAVTRTTEPVLATTTDQRQGGTVDTQSRRSPSVLEPLSRAAHAEVRSEATGQFQLLFTDAASTSSVGGGEVTNGTQLLTWKLPLPPSCGAAMD